MNCSFGDKCNFGVQHIISDPYPTHLGFWPGEPMPALRQPVVLKTRFEVNIDFQEATTCEVKTMVSTAEILFEAMG